MVGRGDARPLETRALEARREGEGREMRISGFDPRQDRRRLEGSPNRGDPKFFRQLEYRRQDRGMQVKMLVRGDVIELEPGGAEGLELGADLRPHLPAHMGQKKHRRAGARHIRPKAPARVDQIRDGRGRQNWLRVNQREMQSDRKPRQSAR